MPSSKSLPTALLGLALACPAMAETQGLELGQVLISADERSGSDAAVEEARERLEQVPGGTDVVDMRQPLQGRVASNQDVLAYQPGVYAQSAGNEGVKISIRGSGINRAPGAHASGLYTMLDGLPLTGPGGTPYELLEPLWVDHVEVLRGANGFDRGALALGGAIDYVSHTGYTAPKLQVRYATGSHGYQQRQVSSGQVLGNFDYYVSLTDANADGYQDHTASESKGLIANFGYRFNPNLETRFYFRYRETDNDLAGRVTKHSIEHSPRAANPAYVARDDSRKQPGSTFIGNKTTFYLDDDSSMAAAKEWHWMIRTRVQPESCIGSISLFDQPGNHRGFWLAPQFQGNGYMREACKVINAFWFDTLMRPLMQVPKAAANHASRKISEDEGMRMAETRDGQFVSGPMPVEVWEITRSEWLAEETNRSIDC